MGIYEETFEKISYRLKQSEAKEKTVIPDGTDEDDALVILFFYKFLYMIWNTLISLGYVCWQLRCWQAIEA